VLVLDMILDMIEILPPLGKYKYDSHPRVPNHVALGYFSPNIRAASEKATNHAQKLIKSTTHMKAAQTNIRRQCEGHK
jgi:hypothetical protein